MDALLNRVKAGLRSRLDPARREALRRRAAPWIAPWIARDLPALATLHGTDKWNDHWYARHYQTHFAPLRRRRLNLLEIGVGGDEDPARGGESLRMWKHYFPRANVYGLDIHDKSAHEEPRIRIFRGSQADEGFLREVAAEIGRLDIVIDDGSHVNEHVVTTFRTLFPLLAGDGLYAVEDTGTSYRERYGGSPDLEARHTMMALFKRLMDGLHHREFRIPGYTPSYTDLHVTEVHAYHNLVVIRKGVNDEAPIV